MRHVANDETSNLQGWFSYLEGERSGARSTIYQGLGIAAAILATFLAVVVSDPLGTKLRNDVVMIDALLAFLWAEASAVALLYPWYQYLGTVKALFRNYFMQGRYHATKNGKAPQHDFNELVIRDPGTLLMLMIRPEHAAEWENQARGVEEDIDGLCLEPSTQPTDQVLEKWRRDLNWGTPLKQMFRFKSEHSLVDQARILVALLRFEFWLIIWLGSLAVLVLAIGRGLSPTGPIFAAGFGSVVIFVSLLKIYIGQVSRHAEYRRSLQRQKARAELARGTARTAAR
jgi:hypothetical protein